MAGFQTVNSNSSKAHVVIVLGALPDPPASLPKAMSYGSGNASARPDLETACKS
jgi:hypothetical protein